MTRRSYIGKKVVTVTVDRPMPLKRVEDLPPQLFRVALLIADGWRNEAVARRLGISEGTLKVYTSDIYYALGYDDRKKDSRVLLAQQVWTSLADVKGAIQRRREFALLVESFTSKLKEQVAC